MVQVVEINTFLFKTMTHLSYIVHTIADDDLDMQAARALATMVQT